MKFIPDVFDKYISSIAGPDSNTGKNSKAALNRLKSFNEALNQCAHFYQFGIFDL